MARQRRRTVPRVPVDARCHDGDPALRRNDGRRSHSAGPPGVPQLLADTPHLLLLPQRHPRPGAPPPRRPLRRHLQSRLPPDARRRRRLQSSKNRLQTTPRLPRRTVHHHRQRQLRRMGRHTPQNIHRTRALRVPRSQLPPRAPRRTPLQRHHPGGPPVVALVDLVDLRGVQRGRRLGEAGVEALFQKKKKRKVQKKRKQTTMHIHEPLVD
mmetsp:Transcript_33661/g.107491  ORF Transcript_33661/g.107491 Transcript_33661/m.107491 type:complete len:211 (+) Transcript_33661:274-906(+)